MVIVLEGGVELSGNAGGLNSLVEILPFDRCKTHWRKAVVGQA